LTEAFDSTEFLERWRQRRGKEEWLFAVAVVKAGLEREGNLDEEAEEQIATALEEFGISADELQEYLEKNREKLLRFLDS
jgi:uncharacterized protein YbcC (UPF0753/DUF2309 family)